MSKQPEALRLADACEQAANIIDMCRPAIQDDWRRQSAAELRRLHEENAALCKEHAEDQAVINVWRGRAQRAEDECVRQHALIAELVESLDKIANLDSRPMLASEVIDLARAALSKAKEQS